MRMGWVLRLVEIGIDGDADQPHVMAPGAHGIGLGRIGRLQFQVMAFGPQTRRLDRLFERG